MSLPLLKMSPMMTMNKGWINKLPLTHNPFIRSTQPHLSSKEKEKPLELQTPPPTKGQEKVMMGAIYATHQATMTTSLGILATLKQA